MVLGNTFSHNLNIFHYILSRIPLGHENFTIFVPASFATVFDDDHFFSFFFSGSRSQMMQPMQATMVTSAIVRHSIL